MRRVDRAVPLGIMTLVVGTALSAGAWVAEPGDGTARELEAVGLADLRLEAFDAVDCLDACVLCPDSDHHSCILNAGNGGYECPHKEACSPFGECGDHGCGEIVPPQEEEQLVHRDTQLQRVASLIPQTSLEDLLSFVLRNEHAVRVNEERNAIQFLGCGGRIAGHVPLPPGAGRLLTEGELPVGD